MNTPGLSIHLVPDSSGNKDVSQMSSVVYTNHFKPVKGRGYFGLTYRLCISCSIAWKCLPLLIIELRTIPWAAHDGQPPSLMKNCFLFEKCFIFSGFLISYLQWFILWYIRKRTSKLTIWSTRIYKALILDFVEFL